MTKVLTFIGNLFGYTGKPKVEHSNTAGRTHSLKTWPEYFQKVKSGEKNFEVRIDDRNYKVRDTLVLREWCPDKGVFTGKYLTREISYILPGGSFGIDENTVILSLKPIKGFW